MELVNAYMGMWPFGILTQQQREGLQRWKYYVENRTFLDPWMQVFWCGLSKRIPECILPCTITVMGFFCNCLPGLALLYYSPNAREEVPSWLMVVAALGLFLYQTADALDGKQCLRLDRDTPLEEIYDHGMDAMTTGFVTMNMCIALGLGDFPFWMFMVAVTSTLLFYTYHWQTYNSGIVIFGKFDVTEAQFSTMVTLLLTAAFGKNLWTTQLQCWGLSVQVRHLLVSGTMMMAYFLIANNLWTILHHASGMRKGCVQGWESLSPGLAVLQLMVTVYLVRGFAPQIYLEQPCLYILVYCTVSALLVLKLVMAHVMDSTFPVFHLGPVIMAVVTVISICLPSINPAFLVYFLLGFALLEFIGTFVLVSLEICNLFNQNVFVPGPRYPAKKTPAQQD